MSYVDPSISDFKQEFFRDFPYGTTNDTVLDQDITRALSDAAFNFNPDLFSSQQNYTKGYLLLSAHFLVMNLRTSSQGVAAQYEWLHGSKGAGSVSESFQVPQRILDNPELAMLSQTRYGAQYLMFLLPQLCGQMFTVRGHTKP